MRATPRNKKAVSVLRGQIKTSPFTKCLTPFAQINNYIKYLAIKDANQFFLRMKQLKMQSSNHILFRCGYKRLTAFKVYVTFPKYVFFK